jgi:hypothetical protein
MKLLKKIAPLAIGVMMMAIPFTAALNVADWKGTFTSSTTAVVVGSGNIGTQDMAAALTVAKAVGIDTITPGTVTGESYLFEKSSDKLNLGEGLDDIRSSITSDQLPTVLADGTYVDDNNNEFDYTQKIAIAGGIDLGLFADKDYDDDKTPTLGFHLARDAAVLNYTLDFNEEPDCGTDLTSTTITIMGKDYYISDAASNCNDLTLLDSGETATVVEGETKTVGGKVIGISYLGDTPEVALTVDGVETNTLEEGDTYKLSGSDTYIGIKDIRYTAKETGKSSVVLSVGKGKIYIENASTVEINDEDVDVLTGFIDNDGDTLAGLTLEWNVDDESFITPTSEIVFPGFEAVKLMMTGVTFPTGEEISLDYDSDSIATITVPIQGGEQEIPLFEDTNGDGDFDVIGADEEYLVTTNGTDASLELDGDSYDAYFVATYYDGSKDAASYYFSFDTSSEGSTDYAIITDETTGSSCKKSAGNTCSFGDVELDIDTVYDDNNSVYLSAGNDVYFDRIYTENGLLIYLPVDGLLNTGFGWVNMTTQPVGYKLLMREENEDDTLGAGDWINATYNFTSADDYVQVSNIDADWSGDLYEESSDQYMGYVESELASMVNWDKTGDQYDAVITYYGEEVYGNAYIAGSASSSGSSGTSWTAVRDSETTAYTSKNVIAIGGTAVNKVARKMLGLTDLDTPVYGYEDAWSTATGVDAIGKGILWIKQDVYTAGKYAMLVAGFEGADTEKTANFLTLGILPASDKALLDTTGSVAVEVTA